MPFLSSVLPIGGALALLGLGAASAGAAGAPDPKAPPSMLPGANSHDPISIDAGKLDFFNKEQKLVYSGNVVAVQGESTLKGSQITIFLSKDEDPKAAGGAATPAPAAASADAPPGQGSSVKHMDVVGPVTIIAKDQIGTGDNATYDKASNKVTMTGNVTLSQGTNVTKGDRLVYDLTSGQAQVFSGQTYTRVRSVFTPGSGGPDEAFGGGPPKKKPGKAKPSGSASAQ